MAESLESLSQYELFFARTFAIRLPKVILSEVFKHQCRKSLNLLLKRCIKMVMKIPFVPFLGTVGACAFFTARLIAAPVSTALICSVPGALFIWLLYQCYIYPYYLSPLRHVPTVPGGVPLFGQFFTIITEEVGVPLRRWHQQHGPMVRYFFPFGAERLSVADDDAIKHMTVRNPYNYPKPERARLWMMPILGEGILLAEGQTHVKQRKALAPAFSISSIRSLLPVFWAKSLHLADLLDSELETTNKTSKCFEFLEWLNRTTLDIIGRAGLGTDIDSLDHPDTALRGAYQRCFDFDLQARILNGLAAFTPLVRLLPSRVNREWEKSRSVILGHASEIIDQKQSETRAKKEQKTKDIIGLIIKDNEHANESGRCA